MVLTHGANSLSVRGDITSITIGGREYPVVDINGVKWLGENLDFKWEGLVVGDNTISQSSPHANYYNNREDIYGINGNKYGLLYNYEAVSYLNSNKDSLCPGWHVPTNAEFDELKSALGTNPGEKLKSISGWTQNGNGNGYTRFDGKPGGYFAGAHNQKGKFSEISSTGDYWSINKDSTYRAYYYRLSYNSSDFVRDNYYTRYQFSLRLVKDV